MSMSSTEEKQVLSVVGAGETKESDKKEIILINAEIYGQAKRTIDVVDNYIGLKTLLHLIGANDGVEIRIYSDNIRKGLRKELYEDFCKESPDLHISFYRSGGIFHDRYIILDHGTEDEKIYLCGGSSKDVGSRATTILEDRDRDKYQGMINGLRGNVLAF